ncbi:CRISP/Allergen/PR-1-like Protein [Tribolium castaneum]|uniref:CRISP/Allergen/PR-1-like Protein n=1 Tax=Tribolium castaneum TaxID=7070 RepID=D6WC22_TRICA|nr:PREDICTED: venom allergen 5 [Tribolium castaneum]EEZ99134.1 CRISP/Allergen/PR-1-like Protein [Tribolium castaneum]|eukprot:XP_008199497.1 PREDICTED: venom allergen 5 [Tribolium castaneum]
MFKVVVFITACLIGAHGQAEFDPKKKDYCKITCQKNVHPGCNCTRVGNRLELGLKQHAEFRQIILDLHNRARNLVASGNETRGELTSASNMMALSYSLELEYFARCYMRNRFNGDRYMGNCIVMENGLKAGQNVIGAKGNQSTINWVTNMFKEWMAEVTLINKTHIDSFFEPSPNEKDFRDFTQIMWATVNEIGCARLYTPDTNKLKYVKPYVSALICNYGITILKDKNLAPNTPGQPVFKRGPPCSDCPEKLKCNQKYPSLCGEIAAIPTSPPYDLDISEGVTIKKFKSLTLLVVTISLSFLL